MTAPSVGISLRRLSALTVGPALPGLTAASSPPSHRKAPLAETSVSCYLQGVSALWNRPGIDPLLFDRFRHDLLVEFAFLGEGVEAADGENYTEG